MTKPEAQQTIAQPIYELSIKSIDVSQTESQQMRRASFDKDGLQQLADSIKSQGIIQPLTVRESGKRYELVCGERRLLAASIAGLDLVPCVVRELSDQQVIEVQVVENLQREGLHPMQEAEAYEQLRRGEPKRNIAGRTIDEIAQMVGMSKAYVYARVKLLALSSEMRKAFFAGEISESVALLLARIPTHELQREALNEISWRGKGEPISFRDAKRRIHDRFMLRLAEAPFDKRDEGLLPGVPSCVNCPKRTGNDRDLFPDVQSADVCTDTTCFALKRRTHGDRIIAAAKERGATVIVGDQAKRLVRYGIDHPIDGFASVKADHYVSGKKKTVGAIVGKDAPRTFIQDQQTGDVGEFIDGATFARAMREKGGEAPRDRGSASSSRSTEHARRKKVIAENKFRVALYERVRAKFKPKIERADLEALVESLWLALWHEYRSVVGKRWSKLKLDTHARKIGPRLRTLSPSDLLLLARDMSYVDELKVGTWDDSTPDKLNAAAKRCKINVAAVRRESQQKPAKKTKVGK